MSEEKRKDKKQGRRVISWLLAAAVVAGLAVMPMLAGENGQDSQRSVIRSAAAERRTLEDKIMGGGQLQSQEAVQVEIPDGVKLTAYAVGNGDFVRAGQSLAAVDKISVMSAIQSVQETLDTLSEEIADASGDKAPETLKALTAATVKTVYAQEGQSAQEVMLAHGALAVLSLDGTMSLRLTVTSDMQPGETVQVSVDGGEPVSGRVASNQGGVLTVTVADSGYAVGAPAAAQTQGGASLGSGTLEITSPWNVLAYSGTVSQVCVQENDAVRADQTLFRLTDTGSSGSYQHLVDQRREYEALMQELYGLYRTETVCAPSDGIVSGVDKNGSFLLSSGGEEWKLSFLVDSSLGDGFRAYPCQVVSLSQTGMELKTSPWGVAVENLAAASAIPVAGDTLTDTWDYTGTCGVYRQDETGLLYPAAAQPGDVLLAVGDEDNLYWFILAGEGSADGTRKASLLSETTPDGSAYAIVTETLPAGTVGQSYSCTLLAAPSADGTWTAEGLPNGLALDAATGVLSGIPQTAGSFSVTFRFAAEDGAAVRVLILTITETQGTYYGYAARIDQITDGAAQVTQSPTPYPIADLTALPDIQVKEEDLTEVKIYTGDRIAAFELKEGDLVLMVVDAEGNLVQVSKLNGNPGGNDPGGNPGGDSGGGRPSFPSGGGSFPSGSFGSLFGGSQQGQSQDDGLYSLEKQTVASVTPQAQMTLEITADELDITKLHVGQTADITVDALAGEHFQAEVTQISGSGTNEGGSSKFTVELTIAKSSEMLPGMNASAAIALQTTQDALCIPAAALNMDGGKNIVFTALDEKTGALSMPVEVTLGKADADSVQILSGLSEGETVYYADYEPEKS